MVLLGPFGTYLPGIVRYFLACGSIIHNAATFSVFHSTLKRFIFIHNFKYHHLSIYTRLGFSHALAFDATRLVAPVTCELLMKLTWDIAVNAFDFTHALKTLLQDVCDLSWHMSNVYLTPNGAHCYTWTHRDIQPWGKHLPIQCFQCGVVLWSLSSA